MIKIDVDDAGALKSLDLMVDSFAELRPVFAKFTKWMRQQVDAVFDSQGDGEWAERSEASQARFDQSKAGRIAKIEASKYTSLISSIRQSQLKVQRRLAKTPADSKLVGRRLSSIARYDAQAAEVGRVAAGGAHAPAGQKKLYERIGRRELRAQHKIAAVQSGALLGQIAGSIKVDWDQTQWVMYSEIQWAGAQNRGATVNNGATLPARTFLQWTPERIAKFVEMVQEHVLRKGAKRS